MIDACVMIFGILDSLITRILEIIKSHSCEVEDLKSKFDLKIVLATKLVEEQMGYKMLKVMIVKCLFFLLEILHLKMLLKYTNT